VIVATYSKENFEQIAAAIGKDVADVGRHKEAFEAAAMWYRLNRKGSTVKRMAPSSIKKRMKQIANAARKLLWHLEVFDYRNAADGPGDFALEALASTEDGSEDEVAKATAQIGRLEEIVKTIDAAQALEQLARKAADDAVQIGELIVPKGHHGDTAVNGWIAEMMSIYKKVTGEDPRTFVIAPGRPGRGNADGSLIRFLDAAYGPCLVAAGEPLDTAHSPASWRGRVRDVLTDGRRKK
jgi:hypothetical protein